MWWDWVKASRNLETMIWEEVCELFMGKCIPVYAQHAKARIVLEYVAKFTELAHFADDYVATDMAKVRKFEDGSKLSIRGKIVGLLLQDMSLMAKKTMAIEREVKDLGLEVETLEESLQVSSSLGTKVSVDQISRDCELEISEILLTVDLRVLDMSEFDVILGMEWLTTHRVVIDCDRRRVTAHTPNDDVLYFRGISMMLYPRLCTILDGTDSCSVGWKALPWRTRQDRSWVYLGWFVSMRMFFRRTAEITPAHGCRRRYQVTPWYIAYFYDSA